MSERQKELERRVTELEAAYEELKKTKEILGARTAVAWIGMISATWAHAVRREVSTILGLLALLQNAVRKGAPPNRINTLFEQVDTAVKRIAEVPLTAPLSAEEGIESVNVNLLLREYVPILFQPYDNMNLILELTPNDKDMAVRASSEWISRAIRIIIENALQAMRNSHQKTLTICTRAYADTVEIWFTDTGSGIPQTVLPHLFVEPIKKTAREKGAGIGLLLASTIVQTYGGEIAVAATGPEGTTIVLTLPREKLL